MVLRDLHPYQFYRIRMSAVNVKGTSNASIPTEFFRTKPDVPSSVPSVLLAQSINSRAIRVRWMVSPIVLELESNPFVLAYSNE